MDSHNPHSSPAPQGHPSPDELAQQMGSVTLGAKPKRKDRHVYHDLTAPAGSSQAFNGIPQDIRDPSSYLSHNPNAPNPNQFPLPAGPQFPSDGPLHPHLSPPFQSELRPGTPLQSSYVNSSQQLGLDQLPSVPQARHEATELYSKQVYPTMERRVPPPAAVPFTAFDQGNSSPRFMRLTMNSIPPTAEEVARTGLPLGLVVQPLAPSDSEDPIPVVDFGEAGPPRCQRCRTYINPFMIFRSGGNKFVCNMCTHSNEVPPEYFSPVDMAGIRHDRDMRPELIKGTVEFTVPKEYTVKKPVPLRWLFLLDSSETAVNRGFLDSLCQGIRLALYNEEPDESGNVTSKLPEGCKVGIATFDKEVHFYDLSPGRKGVNMMVMSDIEEPFVPLQSGLFVNPIESRDRILTLLDSLPQLFSGIKSSESAPLSALMAALDAFEQSGGKILCSLSELPTLGHGKLLLRHSDVSGTVLAAENPDWVDFAPRMASAGVGVDFFLACPNDAFLDTATIGFLSSQTGGDLFYYPNFKSERDSLRVARDFAHSVNRETGLQALMKVRCSNGLQVSEYHGNFIHHTFGADLEFGAIDEDKTIGVLFSYDGKLDPRLDVHFQSALLYTTADGHRRVRCSNMVANISKTHNEPMKFLDQDAILAIIAKQAASRVIDKSLKSIREGIAEKNIEVLTKYRKSISESPAQGHLVLPEMLKELSMYLLGLTKTSAFKGGKVLDDLRVHELRLIKSMSVRELCLYVYPRIYGIHNLDPKHGFLDEQGQLQMPPPVRASFSKVDEGGVYLVDNGQVCLLWIHSRVSPNLLQDLFGPEIDSARKLSPMMSELPVLDTFLNSQVRNMIQYLAATRGSRSLTIQLARAEIDGAEFEYARLLYEDRNNEAQSYVDWLMHVHRQISLELSGHRSSGDGSGLSFSGFRSFWG